MALHSRTFRSEAACYAIRQENVVTASNFMIEVVGSIVKRPLFVGEAPLSQRNPYLFSMDAPKRHVFLYYSVALGFGMGHGPGRMDSRPPKVSKNGNESSD